jgi:hypothetical protein
MGAKVKPENSAYQAFLAALAAGGTTQEAIAMGARWWRSVSPFTDDKRIEEDFARFAAERLSETLLDTMKIHGKPGEKIGTTAPVER